MKKLTLMMTMFLLLLAGSAAAQQEQERELTKAEKKALQEHNGLGGVTVEGSFSDYDLRKDKKGNLNLSINVMGTGISARADITLYKGSNKASVNITPNFNSNRMTLNGFIVPIEKSTVFKGRSL